MKVILTLLILVGCTTTGSGLQNEEVAEAHRAKWCLEEDPTQNCFTQKGFNDPVECLQFIAKAPKIQDEGYWVCELDPTKDW